MPDTDKPLVLVADDDMTTRRLVEVTVKNCGCRVICADNGEEALEKIRDEHPVLAILDVHMPRLSGWEVGKELKAQPEGDRTKIIFLTSQTQEHDVLEGFLSGGSDYLFKPFSPRELQARVRAVLARA